MADPIPEQVAAKVVARLKAITAANGYAFSVADVARVQRKAQGWTPRNLSIAVELGDEVRDPSMDHEGNPAAIGYRLTIAIHAFVRQSDREVDTADNTTENAMVAAVRKAVANSTTWHQFDGVTIDADWGTSRPYVSPQGDHAGQTLVLQVSYRLSETDPFTSRA